MNNNNFFNSEEHLTRVRKKSNGNIKVRPLEPLFCRDCHKELIRYGFEKRTIITSETESLIMISQRLMCKVCRRVYHYIPFSLVDPGKHYGCEYTDKVKETGKIDKTCSADESTQRSWMKKSK